MCGTASSSHSPKASKVQLQSQHLYLTESLFSQKRFVMCEQLFDKYLTTTSHLFNDLWQGELGGG
jgi:hypothetical protein